MRQFIRRVLLFIQQRKQPSDDTMQADPLAQFPARVRDIVCEIVDSYGSQRGLNFEAIIDRELEPGEDLSLASLDALPAVVEATTSNNSVILDAEPGLEAHSTAFDAMAANESMILEAEPGRNTDSEYYIVEPRLEHLTAEVNNRTVKAQLRLEIWRSLHQMSPNHTEKLDSDLLRNNISRKAFAYLQRHQCPLGFVDHEQYVEFMKDLSRHLCGLSLNTASQNMTGFTLVIGGSAARLYSEGRWLEKYEHSPPEDLHQADLEVFDQTSDLDVSVHFHVPDIAAWTDDIFGAAGRGKWAWVQVATRTVKGGFGLGDFFLSGVQS